jgi:DNA-binding NarL/FixJ family response regulator
VRGGRSGISCRCLELRNQLTEPGLVQDSATDLDVVLMDIPTGAQLNEWQGFHNNDVALMVLIDVAEAGDTVEALNAGAQAILRRSASRNEIVTDIRAVMGGLVVLQPEILTTWLDETPLADGSLENIGSERARLTRRELEVLACHGRWCLKQSGTGLRSDVERMHTAIRGRRTRPDRRRSGGS